jgi:hypothetical protein
MQTNLCDPRHTCDFTSSRRAREIQGAIQQQNEVNRLNRECSGGHGFDTVRQQGLFGRLHEDEISENDERPYLQ